MADGVKGGLAQVGTDIVQEMVKPITDEVGRAIEQGAQSMVGSGQNTPPDPQEQTRKRADEEKRKQAAWDVIKSEWNKQLEASMMRVRQQAQQAKEKEQQQKTGEKDKKKEVVFKQKEKENMMEKNKKDAQRRTEQSKKLGG